MKKRTRSIISSFAGMLCAVCFALGLVNFPQSETTAKAENMGTSTNVQMVAGASVRIGDRAGIRFQSMVERAYYDGEATEAGVYLIPYDLLDGELTNETPNALKVRSQVSSTKSTTTHYLFNSVLWDIPASSYGRPIAARAYVRVGDDYYWAANMQVRSFSYVASGALRDGVDSTGEALSAEAVTALNAYVDAAVSSFAFADTSYTLNVGGTQTARTSITMTYPGDASNLFVKYTSNNESVATVSKDGEITGKSAGIAEITATLGSKSATVAVLVNGENQDLVMTDATYSLNADLPVGYTVESIYCNGENWGTDLSNLAISDELKANVQSHGEMLVAVKVTKEDNAYTLQLPVTLITGKITTLAEWQSAIQPTAEGDAKYGYYVLGNNITVNTNTMSVLTANTTASPNGADGFRGTIDGRGYELKNTAAWWKYGMFGEIGSGAVIKNVTFSATGLAAYGGERYLLARVAVGATFENVNVNLENLNSATDLRYGIIFDHGARKCTFTNVTVYISGAIGSLFGGSNNITYWGLNGAGEMCTFTNCNVILAEGATLSELGHRGDYTAAIGESTHIKYVGENQSTANGETALTGISVLGETYTSATLASQELLLTDSVYSIELGAYADYEVQSITLGGYDLGKDPANLSIPDALKTNKQSHGEQTITVVAKKLAETATLTIPVTLITAELTTMEELIALMPTGKASVTYGYYTLGNDIGSADTLIGAGNRWFAAGVSELDGANYGFKATLDGKGYEVTFAISNADGQTGYYGLFGFVGTGATFKNITFTNEAIRAQWATYMFAKSIDGATFENVTFNLNNVQHRYTNYGVFAQEIVNTTFKNVDIISKPTTSVYDNVAVLFTDSGESGNGIFSGNTFDNTQVILFAGARYAALAKNGTTVYTAEGLEVAGATMLEGITVTAPQLDKVTMTGLQKIDLSGDTYRIVLGEYTQYTIQSIKLGAYDLGLNPTALDMTAVKADTSVHGEQTILVTIDKGMVGTEIAVPVLLITDRITTADEFKAIMPKSASGVTYGYYVLANDIGDASTVIGADGRSLNRTASSADVGFRGTIDGNGYTFTFTMAGANVDGGTNDQWGVFGYLGNGATVKNITFNCIGVRASTGTHLFGQSIQGATFENVTIEIGTIYARYANAGVFAVLMNNTTFKDVEIMISDKQLYATTLFANPVNSWDGTASFSGNTFENVNVYLRPSVTIESLANDGTAAITEIAGVTVSVPEIDQVELEYSQTIYLQTNTGALDLGEYAEYAVKSIKLGSYDLGLDLNALELTAVAADTTVHGEQEIVVTIDKGFVGTEVLVPVMLVTKVITTADEFMAIMPKTASAVTYGYYVLGNDVGGLDTVVGANGRSIGRNLSAVSADLGFRGTIDGNGYTFTFTFNVVDIDTGTTDQYGLFGFMGNGATVKNMNFVCGNMRMDVGTHFLGQNVQGATFENVTFTFNKVYSRYASGMMATSITNSTFKNVDLLIKAVEMKWALAPIVFAGAVNTDYEGAAAFSGNTFANTNVYLFEGTSIASLANDGTNAYASLDGVTVTNVTERAETLAGRQELVLSDTTLALELGKYNHYEFTSIKTTVGETEYDLGTNPASLTIPDDLKMDMENHGDATIIAKAERGADLVALTIPVTFVTYEITSLDEWKAVIQPTAEGDVIYGYYTLGGDVLSATNSVSVLTANMTASPDGSDGFRGTLDGKGYQVYNNAAWWKYGYFGEIGNGAVIKNVTFGTTGLAAYAGERYLLARVAIGATFENVTFNLENLTSATNTTNGAILDHGCRSSTFRDVTFNVTGTVASLLGGTTSQYWGLNVAGYESTFENCQVNMMTKESAVTEFGHSGTAVYVAQGMSTANGEVALGGVQLRTADGAYLLLNKASSYTVVTPESPDVYVTKAANELTNLFYEATGATLSVITDKGLVHAENSTYISLGDTNLYKTSGLSVEGFGDDSYMIQSKDSSIYVIGGSSSGTLYGVYGLLNELFGFEVYAKDTYTLDTSKTIIPSQTFNATGVPTFAMRSQAGIPVNESANNYQFADRIRANDSYWGSLLPIMSAADATKTNQGHNSLYYFPKETYYATYPEFYSTESNWTETDWGVTAQLCYTAQGKSTYSTMVQLAAERIEASLQKYTPSAYPNYNSVMLGIQDNYCMCKCSACNAVVSQYGAISATIILFLDDVADLVEAWMDQNPAYKRDLQYMFFAYQQSLTAPTTMPTVNNKIAPFVAMSEMHHGKAANDTTSHSLTEYGTVTNARVLSYVQTWGNWAVQNGGAAWAWMYGNFFRDYFCFYDSYTFYGTIFPYLEASGYEFVYVQQQSKQTGWTSAFMTLNTYVTSKLSWDASLDMDTLIADYMDAMYLEASDEMMAIFEKWQSIYASKLSGLGLGYEKPGSKMTYKLVDELLTLFDNAYAAIEQYKGDTELYNKLKRHIDAEYVAPAKIACVEFKKYFDGSYFWYSTAHDYSDIAANFKAIVADLGMTYANEFNAISTITGSL